MMVNEVQKRSRELEKSGWKFFKIHFSEKGLRAQGKSGLCQPFRSLARHPELLIKKIHYLYDFGKGRSQLILLLCVSPMKNKNYNLCQSNFIFLVLLMCMLLRMRVFLSISNSYESSNNY